MGQAGQGGVDLTRGGRGGSLGKLMAKHGREGDAASAQAGVSEELAAGLLAVEFEKGVHRSQKDTMPEAGSLQESASGGDEVLHVLAEHIELDIEAAAGAHGFEVRHCDGMRDDPAGDGLCGDFRSGEGDAIEAGEAIMVVESDKADMDVEAFEDGFLAKILTGEGESAEVGAVVALVASSEEDIAAVANGGGAAAPAAAPVAEAAAPVAASAAGKF